jgi:hypothetical protein
MVSPDLLSLHLRVQSRRYPLDERLDGLQIRYGRDDQENSIQQLDFSALISTDF